jgi:hypothetical protein
MFASVSTSKDTDRAEKIIPVAKGIIFGEDSTDR